VSYEPTIQGTRKPEAAVHTGHGPIDRTVLQYIVQEAECTQPEFSPTDGAVSAARQYLLPSSSTWQQIKWTHIKVYLILQFILFTTVRLELKAHTHHTIASFYLVHDHDGSVPNTITQQLIRTHLRNSSW